LGRHRVVRAVDRIAAPAAPTEVPVKIYLAASYKNHPEMRIVRGLLNAIGHDVTSRWIEGNHTADTPAQSRLFGEHDLEDLERANMLIAFLGPSTTGGWHVEFGYALAIRRRDMTFGDDAYRIAVVGAIDRNVFHHLPEVEVYPDLDSVLQALR
jgi:hypothetical protein